jgi:hypothetical protein
MAAPRADHDPEDTTESDQRASVRLLELMREHHPEGDVHAR